MREKSLPLSLTENLVTIFRRISGRSWARGLKLLAYVGAVVGVILTILVISSFLVRGGVPCVDLVLKE